MIALPPQFNHFSQELKTEILQKGIIKTVPKGTELIREGQYIKVIPLVLNGLIKVTTHYDSREFLLYYIQPSECCIMSFFGAITDSTSKIFAQTEADSEMLLLPSQEVKQWLVKYPELNLFFHQLNNTRYIDMVETIQEILFENLDSRILNFLKEKARQSNSSFVKIRHREIADALGTTREVISRITKKLEHDRKIEQFSDGIEVRL